MSSNICFKADILNALRAAYIANQGSARVMARTLERCSVGGMLAGEILEAYNTGFATALAAVGVAFGLDQADEDADEDAEDERKAVESPLAFLLEVMGRKEGT